MELRDYQVEALNHLRARIEDGERRMYLDMPTGTGKTRILSELVAETLARGDRVGWVVHLRELVTQAARMLEGATGATPGIVMAEDRDVDADLVVGSVQSLENRRLQETLEHGEFNLLVIDEAHHVTAANRYAKLIDQVSAESPDLVIVGATATPYRNDGHRMQDVLPVCAFTRSIAEMQKAGVLCPLGWRPIRLRDLDLRRIRAGVVMGDRDYRERDLSHEMTRGDIVAAIVQATASGLEGRVGLAFAVDVEHAQLMAEAYQDAGLRAEAVWGTMPHPDRARILDRWRRGKLDIVTNCAILGEGFDYPEIDALVLARPTMSAGRYVQQLGRGLRVAPGKDNLLVFDFTGRTGVVDTRQVQLPQIVGVQGGDGFSGDGRRDHLLRLLDPDGKARWGWGRRRSVYYAILDRDTYAALVPDDSGSGLYNAYLVGDAVGVERIDLGAIPLRQAVGAVEGHLKRSHRVVATLANKDRTWRSNPPSDKQLAYLRKLSPKRARRAIDEEWTKGRVALEISGVTVLDILREEGIVEGNGKRGKQARTKRSSIRVTRLDRPTPTKKDRPRRVQIPSSETGTRPCRYCDVWITFKSGGDKWRPVNASDGTPHRCSR